MILAAASSAVKPENDLESPRVVTMNFDVYTPPKFNSEFTPAKMVLGRQSPFLLGPVQVTFQGRTLQNYQFATSRLPLAPKGKDCIPTIHGFRCFCC